MSGCKVADGYGTMLVNIWIVPNTLAFIGVENLFVFENYEVQHLSLPISIIQYTREKGEFVWALKKLVIPILWGGCGAGSAGLGFG